MSTDLRLSSIGQISMTAHDLPRAKAFYRDVLGLPFLFEAPPSMAFFDVGGIRLMLGVPESPAFDHPGSILYFRVEDIHGSYRELERRGAELVHEPRLIADLDSHELWLAFFEDTEGNHLALMSEVPKG